MAGGVLSKCITILHKITIDFDFFCVFLLFLVVFVAVPQFLAVFGGRVALLTRKKL